MTEEVASMKVLSVGLYRLVFSVAPLILPCFAMYPTGGGLLAHSIDRAGRSERDGWLARSRSFFLQEKQVIFTFY